jgi:cytochrome P450
MAAISSTMAERKRRIPGERGSFSLARVAQGFHSWLSLIPESSYRAAVGQQQLPGSRMLLVNHPSLVRKVLVEQAEQFPKHPYTMWMLEPLIGRASFSVNGEEWRQQREGVDSALALTRLSRIYPQMHAAIADCLDRMEARVGATSWNVAPVMTQFTADVIVRTIFSLALPPAEAQRLETRFQRYQNRAGTAAMLALLGVPQPWLRRYLARHARPIRDWIQTRVDERLRGGCRASGTGTDDLLDALIATERFTNDELVDQVCMLFLAGHETSASALAMTLHLLAIHPEVQKQLQAEIDQLLGDNRAGIPTLKQLRELKYTRAVFEEALRLYPPLPFLVRESQRDTSLAGQQCPFKAMVSISPWVVHRHHRYWRNPEQFDPQRFITERASLTTGNYLPFGLGPRTCPGASFAIQEATMLIAAIILRYHIHSEPSKPPKLVGRLTLRARQGVWIRMESRWLNGQCSNSPDIQI